MENLGRLRQIQGGHRSTVMKLEQEARETLILSDPLTEDDLTRLEAIKELLENKRRILQTQDETISNLVDENELESEILASSHIKLRITEILTRIQRWLWNEGRPRRLLPPLPSSKPTTPTSMRRRLLPLPPTEQHATPLWNSPSSCSATTQGNGFSQSRPK